ncbi:MAG: hypothetical protein ACRD6W_13755 [Nitrososphaerales archaeon]
MTALVAVASTATPAFASSTPKVSPSFVKKVDASCTGFASSFNRAGESTFPYPTFNPTKPQRSLLKKVGHYFDKGARLWEAVPGKLRGLGVPTRGAATWTKLRALADRLAEDAVTQARTATAGNARKFVAAVKEYTAVLEKLNAAARAAGFGAKSACAKFFG